MVDWSISQSFGRYLCQDLFAMLEAQEAVIGHSADGGQRHIPLVEDGLDCCLLTSLNHK